MEIKISSVISINDCILAIYYCNDQTYRFSVVNTIGRTYTSESSFPTLVNARFTGISVTNRLAVDRQ